MKIAYYCQHVLGIGHFHRSLEICRALASGHQVTLIVGGPEVVFEDKNISLHRLPGLRMDATFHNLAPTDHGQNLEDVKERRLRMLFSLFGGERFDALVVELYPFGRKAFRFELDPLLTAIGNGQLPPCRCYVSLRDILVERPGNTEKFERLAVQSLNRWFAGLLIHADPEIITLEKTFSRVGEIEVPMAYTGFVAPPGGGETDRARLRAELGLEGEERLIVASIGGGNVGGELLAATCDAFRLLPEVPGMNLQIFTGPYLPGHFIQRLQECLPPRARLAPFTTEFPAWLQAADLSISMAGYNTCMNVVQAGVPALVLPFAENREQRLRAERLRQKAAIIPLSPADLAPPRLAAAMEKMIARPRQANTINLDGALQSRRIIETWQGQVENRP